MSDFVKDINVPTNDCISRQAAIDAIHEDADWLAAQGSDWQAERMERDKSILKSLPTVQPNHNAEVSKKEIIHCKDCVYHGWDCVDAPYGVTEMIHWCDKFYTGENENLEVEPTDFCKWGDRKGKAK